MRKIWYILIMLIVFSCSKSNDQSTPKLVINSTPPGAAITMDGLSTGKVTPYEFIDILIENHTIKLSLDGYEDSTISVNIEKNIKYQVDILLKKVESGWVNINSGTVEHLKDVWGSSEDDIFVVGNNGTILHYNGSTWSSMNSTTTEPLNGIWGFAPNDVFAVGEKLTILHYNGTAWSKMSASNPGFSPLFRAIWGAGKSDLWAVGSGYLRMHYNGTSWSGSTNIITNNLYACWGSSSNYVLAVGDYGSVYRYNGTSWSGDLDVADINDLWLCFEGIWGVSSSVVFLVGDYDSHGTGDGDNSGTVIKYTGSEWISLWKDNIPELRGIWGLSSTDFYVIGLKGSIAHYDGSVFSVMESNTANNLLGIWGNQNEIIVVGAHGTILSYTR